MTKGKSKKLDIRRLRKVNIARRATCHGCNYSFGGILRRFVRNSLAAHED